MFCAKIGGNLPSASHQQRFLNFVNVFSLFRYFPWEKGMALLWKKLEFPSQKDALCQVWLKMAMWFWRARFLNFVNVHVFSIFRYFPSEKGGPFI